jgi:hypothetical protein
VQTLLQQNPEAFKFLEQLMEENSAGDPMSFRYVNALAKQ